MKTLLHSSPRSHFAVAALFLLPLITSAHGASPADAMAQALARNGSIHVNSVGPYVESGTYRVQVAVKLGRPSYVLPDGTWLYQGYIINDSDASGTLVVRFQRGRVSELSLATPATVASLRGNTGKAQGKFFAAAESRR